MEKKIDQEAIASDELQREIDAELVQEDPSTEECDAIVVASLGKVENVGKGTAGCNRCNCKPTGK